MRKLHRILHMIHIPMLKSTFWQHLMAVRTSFKVRRKTGGAGSGTLGSFCCTVSAMDGGLGGGGGGRRGAVLRLLSVTSSSIASRSVCRFVRLPQFSSRDKVGHCQFAWP
jgi:hypothetical protein